jgi:hypothetical protein
VAKAESKDHESFMQFWHPFECKPFIVHTDRACDCDDCFEKVRDKAAIKVLAKEMSEEEYAIKVSAKKTHPWYKPKKPDYYKDSLSCVIEQAVQNLAESFGGKWCGT